MNSNSVSNLASEKWYYKLYGRGHKNLNHTEKETFETNEQQPKFHVTTNIYTEM